MRARAFGVAAFFGILTACASSAPPRPVEPEPSPLEIPPLSPQAAPPERPTAREAPAVATPAEADGEEADGVPSPLALPCKSDAECMTHRCNMGLAKCAFPCKSDRDCVAGATCFTQGGAMASCIPKPPP
jgi:hypothetical protein